VHAQQIAALCLAPDPQPALNPSPPFPLPNRVLNLLKAQGTVPIHYQGVKYNIPVIVWLPERYPNNAPLVYVTPTPNMVIKHNHSCVDPSGQVGRRRPPRGQQQQGRQRPRPCPAA
jgi:hypothetical protein